MVRQSVRGPWNPGPLAGAYISWMLSHSRIDRIVGERMRNHLWQAARWVVHEAGAIGQSVMGDVEPRTSGRGIHIMDAVIF